MEMAIFLIITFVDENILSPKNTKKSAYEAVLPHNIPLMHVWGSQRPYFTTTEQTEEEIRLN